MSNIRGKNTKIELAIRSELHNRGFRFRLHDKRIPGKPDIVFPKFKAVVFVHGCFWHGHNCHLFKWPKTREEFWREKIEKNRLRDTRTMQSVVETNWRCMIVWECAIKGRLRLPLARVADEVSEWLLSDVKTAEIRGIE